MQLYKSDEDDEGDGPLILEHAQLLPHKDFHGVRQVVHSLLGRVQVQDLGRTVSYQHRTRDFYRVTIQVVPVLLMSKQRLHFCRRSIYWNAIFVF